MENPLIYSEIEDQNGQYLRKRPSQIDALMEVSSSSFRNSLRPPNNIDNGMHSPIAESIMADKRNDLMILVQEIMSRLDRVIGEIRFEIKKTKKKNKMNKKYLKKKVMKHKQNSRIYTSNDELEEIKPKGILKNKNRGNMRTPETSGATINNEHNTTNKDKIAYYHPNKKKINSTKRQVFFNDKKWNIVTSLINGIYKSINLISTDHKLVPSELDFSICNKIELEAVLEKKFKKCKFKDYAPNVFEAIRNTNGISNESYVESIGYHTFQKAFLNKLSLMLKENSSGKSGSFFFHTADMKYMIKTIKKSEFFVLKDMLPEYFKYIIENPETLITKYYGLHQLKCYNKNSRIVYTIYVGTIITHLYETF
jgi:hypothetical protein